MRLGQLARILGLSPAELENGLQEKYVGQEFTSNTRLDRERLEHLVLRFAPDKLEQIIGITDADEAMETTAPVDQLPAQELPEAPPNDPDVKPQPVLNEFDGSEVQELPDIIRAPKVELRGLRVLGKVELPEPPKKEIVESTDTNPPVGAVAPEQPAPHRNRERFPRRQPERKRVDANPIARERERQERMAKKKREEEAQRRKEFRTIAYVNSQSRKQSSGKAKAKLKKAGESKSAVGTSLRPKPKPKPTTWLGRFWRWLAHGE